MASGNFLRRLRQLSLIVLLVAIAAGSYLTRARTTSWQETLWVGAYPIAGDASERTREYIAALDSGTFAPVEAFLARESRRYGVAVERLARIDVGRPIADLPPDPPASSNPLRIAWWSLKLRWWTLRALAGQPGAPPDIRLFLVYHDPAITPALPHSLGLRKGMVGVAHVFADRREAGRNNVVIAHEMLHTLGATDKYAADTNFPVWPDGFAEPGLEPRVPQHYAEIMAGRIPLSADEAVMPAGLPDARVGDKTAAEIRWGRD